MTWPAPREQLYRRFLAEEIASAQRHQVINKLTAVGALRYHLGRQLPQGDERLDAARAVLSLIDAQVAEASEALGRRFLDPPPSAAPLPLGPAAASLVASWVPPSGVALAGPEPGNAAAVIDAAELDLAIACLVDNAVDAVATGGGRVRVRCASSGTAGDAAEVMIEIDDDGPGLATAARTQALEPFFTTRPGRLGLGLCVAKRVAQRWCGRLEIIDRPSNGPGDGRGVCARLLLPQAGAGR